MTTKVHSTLTGSDLHENKGVSGATDNHVATASSGATVWKKLTAENLDATANPFGAALFHVAETVLFQSRTSGTFTENLNTEITNEIASATLIAKQISLPAGTYYIDAEAATRLGAVTFTFGAFLYNVTTSTTLVSGRFRTVGALNSTTNDVSSYVKGRFTLAGTSTLELRSWCSSSGGVSGTTIGIATDTGTQVLIWKVA